MLAGVRDDARNTGRSSLREDYSNAQILFKPSQAWQTFPSLADTTNMLAGAASGTMPNEMRVSDVERCGNLPRGRALPVPLAPPYYFVSNLRFDFENRYQG